MNICPQHELSEEQRRTLYEQIARRRGPAEAAYRWAAQRIRRDLLEEMLYISDLTHLACELIAEGVKQGEITPEEVSLLAKNRVPVDRIFHYEWLKSSGLSDPETEIDPPDCFYFDSDHFLEWVRSSFVLWEPLFAGFWHMCHLVAEDFTLEGTRRKSTLALLGQSAERAWTHPLGFFQYCPSTEEVPDDAEAAREYEWDILGDPEFVNIMELVLRLAKRMGLTRWTAEIDYITGDSRVRIRRHHEEGDDAEVLEDRRTFLHDLLQSLMPMWAIQSISTEKGSSAPVFGLPERQIFVTAVRPSVREHEWGLIACIPRFYSPKALRLRAQRDFKILMKAMDRNQPRMERSLDNVYSYARRVRDELFHAGWKDVRAMERVKELSKLSDREVYRRLGWKGRGGEGRKRPARAVPDGSSRKSTKKPVKARKSTTRQTTA